MEILLIVCCRVRISQFVFIEETELAIGKRILRINLVRGEEGLFRLCLVFFERCLTFGRFQQGLLLLLLAHIKNFLALLSLAVGGELFLCGEGRFSSERAIRVAEEQLILRVDGECVDEPCGADHCGARTTVFNVGVGVGDDGWGYGDENRSKIVLRSARSCVPGGVRIGERKGLLPSFCHLGMVVKRVKGGSYSRVLYLSYNSNVAALA